MKNVTKKILNLKDIETIYGGVNDGLTEAQKETLKSSDASLSEINIKSNEYRRENGITDNKNSN